MKLFLQSGAHQSEATAAQQDQRQKVENVENVGASARRVAPPEAAQSADGPGRRLLRPPLGQRRARRQRRR